MSMAAAKLLTWDPSELVFRDVKYGQAQTQSLLLHNNARVTIEGEIRPGSSDRYSVNPSRFAVKPGAHVEVQVTLRVLRYAARQRAIEQGQRDHFQIKTPHFDDRFSAIFYLDPEAGDSSSSRASNSARSSPLQSRHATRSMPGSSEGGAPSSTAARSLASNSRSLPTSTAGQQEVSEPAAVGGQLPPPAASAGGSSAEDTPASSARSWLEAQASASSLKPALKRSSQGSSNPGSRRSSTYDEAGGHREPEGVVEDLPPLQRSRTVSFVGVPPATPSPNTKHDAAAAVGGASGSAGFFSRSWAEQVDAALSQAPAQEQLLAALQDAVANMWEPAPAGEDDGPAVAAHGTASWGGASYASYAQADAAHAGPEPSLLPAPEAGSTGSSYHERGQHHQEHQHQQQHVQQEQHQLQQLQQQLGHMLHAAPAAGLQGLIQGPSGTSTPGQPPAAQQGRPSAEQQHHQQQQQQQSPAADGAAPGPVGADPWAEVAALRGKVDSLEAALAAAQRVAAAAQAGEGQPDVTLLVEMAVAQEQAAQEARNQRALQLLLSKDATISQLQQELAAATAELAHGQAASDQMEHVTVQVLTAQDRAQQALAEVSALQQQLELERQQHQEEVAALCEELERLQQQVASQQAEYQHLKEEYEEVSRDLLEARDQGEPSAARQCAAAMAGLRAKAAGVAAASPSPVPGRSPAASPCKPGAPSSPAPVASRTAASRAAPDDASAGEVSAEVARLSSLLADRDAELALLGAELVAAQAAVEALAPGVGADSLEPVPAGQLLRVQRALADKDLALRVTQEQLVATQAQLAVLREAGSAARSAQAAAAAQVQEATAASQRSSQEAQLSRHMAAKLNVRISELTSQLQAAQRQVEALTQGRDALLDGRQEGQQPSSSQPSAASGSPRQHPHHHHLQQQQQQQQQQQGPGRPSWQDAEVALSALQARLVAAQGDRVLAEERLAAAQAAATRAAVRAEGALAAAREEGSVKVAALEATVARLSARSDLAGQVACVSAELSAARRREVRLRADLAQLQQEAAAKEADLEQARCQVADLRRQDQEQLVWGVYPLMRALAILEQLAQAGADGRLTTGAKDAQQQQQPQATPAAAWRPLGLAADLLKPGGAAHGCAVRVLRTLKLPEDMGPQERAAAATAAAAWRNELEHQQQLLAHLAQRAEDAEMALAEARLSRQPAAAAGGGGLGGGALDVVPVSPSRAPGVGGPSLAQLGAFGAPALPDSGALALALTPGCSGDEALVLQQQVWLLETQLRTTREGREALEVQLAQVKAELEAAHAAASAASAALAEMERSAYDRRQQAQQGNLQAVGRLTKELSDMQQQLASAAAEAETAQAGMSAAESELRRARLELGRVRAEAHKQQEAAAAKATAAESHAAELQSQLQAKSRCIARLEARCEEREGQLAVLTDTVETLTAGSSEEVTQRLVVLTATATAAAAREAAAQQRAADLLAVTEDQQQQLASLKQHQEAARVELASQQAAAATTGAQVSLLEQQLQELRADAAASARQVQAASRDLEVLRLQLTAAEAAAAGHKEALAATQQRHAQQLAKERQEATEQLQRQAAQQVLQQLPLEHTKLMAHLTAALDVLVASTQAAADQQAATAAAAASCDTAAVASAGSALGSKAWRGRGGRLLALGSRDVSWVPGVVARLKGLLLEADKVYCQGQAQLALAQQGADRATARLLVLEAALDVAQGQVVAAEVGRQALLKALATRQQQANRHTEERLKAQAKRIAGLTQQQQDLCQQLMAAQVSSNGNAVAAAQHKQRGAAAQLQVEALGAQCAELEAIAAAAAQEAAGVAVLAKGASWKEGLAARDAALMRYFDRQLGPMLRGAAGDVQEQLSALTQEVCALKVVEAQQAASLAAAQRRADGACLRAQRLAAALEAQRHQGPREGGDAAGSAEEEAGLLHLQVAELTAGAGASSAQVYDLQDQLLQAQQREEAYQLEVHELQQQLSAASHLVVEGQQAGQAALSELAGQVEAAAAVQLQRVQAELAAIKSQLKQQVASSQAALQEAEATAAQEMSGRLAAATEGLVPAAALQESVAAEASARAELEVATRERDALQQQVSELTMQVQELQDDKEINSSALSSLEATLARIEAAEASSSRMHRSASAAAGRSPRPIGSGLGSGVSSTRSSGGGGVEEGPGGGGGSSASVALLSKELVAAKMAQADLERKLRVSARVEVELRGKLADRDERISELKQQAAAANRAAVLAQRSKVGGSGAGARTPGPALSALLSDGTAAAAAGSVGSRKPGAGKQYLVQQIADLRVALAKRDAEVSRLEQQLALAAAGAGPQHTVHAKLSPASSRKGSLQDTAVPSRQGSMAQKAGALMVQQWESLEAAAADAPVLAGELQQLQADVAAAVATAQELVQVAAGALGEQAGPAQGELAQVLPALVKHVHQALDQLQQLEQQRQQLEQQLQQQQQQLQQMKEEQQQQQQQQQQPASQSSRCAPAAAGATGTLRSGFSTAAVSSVRGTPTPSSLRSTPRQQSPRPSHELSGGASLHRLQLNSQGEAGGGSSSQELLSELEGLHQQLQQAVAEREELAQQLSQALAHKQQLSKQVESVTTERDKLAGQNVSLAAAVRAGLEAAATSSQAGWAGEEGTDSASAGPGGGRGGGRGPSRPQLKELGQLMQRLTQDNADLLRQRDAAEQARLALEADRAAWAAAEEQLQGALEAAQLEAAEAAAQHAKLAAERAAGSQALQAAQQTVARLNEQMAALREERNNLALHNAALANTTQQLMVAAAGPDTASRSGTALGPENTPPMGWGSEGAPDWLDGKAGPGGSGTGGPPHQRGRAMTEPSAPAAAAAGTQGGRPRINSTQLREIANMLQRLTRDNAALIQARDAAQAALQQLHEELGLTQAALAAAEASVGAAQQQAAVRQAAAQEAGTELCRLRAGARKYTTHKERLQAEVAALMRERDSLAQQNAALAATTGRLMGAGTESSTPTTTSGPTLASVLDSRGSRDDGRPDFARAFLMGGVSSGPLARSASTPGNLGMMSEPTLLTPGQAKEIGALLSRLTRENAAFLRSRDAAAGERDAALERVSGLEVELELLTEQLRSLEAAVQHSGGLRLSTSTSSAPQSTHPSQQGRGRAIPLGSGAATEPPSPGALAGGWYSGASRSSATAAAALHGSGSSISAAALEAGSGRGVPGGQEQQGRGEVVVPDSGGRAPSRPGGWSATRSSSPSPLEAPDTARMLEMASALQRRLEHAAAAQQQLDDALKVVEVVAAAAGDTGTQQQQPTEPASPADPVSADAARPNVAAAAAAVLRGSSASTTGGSYRGTRSSEPAAWAAAGRGGGGTPEQRRSTCTASVASSSRSGASACLAAGAAAEGLAAARPSNAALADELAAMQGQLGQLTQQLTLLAVAQQQQEKQQGTQPMEATLTRPGPASSKDSSHGGAGRRVSADFSFPAAAWERAPAASGLPSPRSSQPASLASTPPVSGGRASSNTAGGWHQEQLSLAGGLVRSSSDVGAGDRYQPVLSGTTSPRGKAQDWGGGGGGGGGVGASSSPRGGSRLGAGRSSPPTPGRLSTTGWEAGEHEGDQLPGSSVPGSGRASPRGAPASVAAGTPAAAAATPSSHPGSPRLSGPTPAAAWPSQQSPRPSSTQGMQAGPAWGPPSPRAGSTTDMEQQQQQQGQGHGLLQPPQQFNQRVQQAQWHWQQAQQQQPHLELQQQQHMEQQQQEQLYQEQQQQQQQHQELLHQQQQLLQEAAAAQQQVVLLQQQLAKAVGRTTKWKGRARQLALQLRSSDQQAAAGSGAGGGAGHPGGDDAGQLPPGVVLAGAPRESQESISSGRGSSSGAAAAAAAGWQRSTRDRSTDSAVGVDQGMGVGPTARQRLLAELKERPQVPIAEAPLLQRLHDALASLEAGSSSQLAALAQRLEEVEGAATPLLQQVTAAAGVGQQQLRGALTAAAGLEAKMNGLERRLGALQQAHDQDREEQGAALEQAAALGDQLATLQQQLSTTTAAYQAQRDDLAQQLALAQAALREQEAAVAQLAAALEAEAAAHQQQVEELVAQHDLALGQLQQAHEAEVQQLQAARDAEVAAARSAGENAAAGAASQQLASLAAAARDAEGQLSLLAAQFRGYQEQKAAEVSALEQRLAAAMSRRIAGQGLEAAAAARGGVGRRAHQGKAAGKGARLGQGHLRRRGVGVRRPKGTSEGGTDLDTGDMDAMPSHMWDDTSTLPTAEPSGLTASTTFTGPTLPHDAYPPGGGLYQQRMSSTAAAVLQQLPHRAAGVAAEVAVVVEQERLAAAQRDVQWERLLRQRAEGAVEAQRAVSARLKAKVKGLKEEVAELKAAAAAGAVAAFEAGKARDEANRLAGELVAAKDLLRAARNNGARRQRAAAATAAALLGGSLRGSEAAALATAAATAAAHEGGGGGEGGGPNVEGLSLALAALSAEVSKERGAKEALEGRLREARAAIERKNALIRELKARSEELAGQLVGGGAADLEARLAAAEGRGRSLAAALGRKEAALAAAQGRLEAATKRLEEAGAAGGASAAELERQVKMVGRLRAEVARKEGLLTELQVELAAAREQSRCAQSAAAEAGQAQAAGAGAAAELRRRLSALGQALRMAGGSLASCCEALTTARGALGQVLGGQGNASQPANSNSSNSGSPGQGGVQPSGSMTAAEVAALVGLDCEEVADLLGGSWGQDTNSWGPWGGSQQQQQQLAVVPGHPQQPLGQGQVAALSSQLEGAISAMLDGMVAGGAGGSSTSSSTGPGAPGCGQEVALVLLQAVAALVAAAGTAQTALLTALQLPHTAAALLS